MEHHEQDDEQVSLEVRERAVRLGLDAEGRRPSRWQAIVSMAAKSGCMQQPLHNWVAQSERDAGKRVGPSTDQRERVKALKHQNRELRQANEIRPKASAEFAPAELDRRPKT
jgi:transposase-like protein